MKEVIVFDRRYLYDKLIALGLFTVLGVIACLLPSGRNSIIPPVLTILSVLSCGYEFFLLIVDMICGKKVETGYFYDVGVWNHHWQHIDRWFEHWIIVIDGKRKVLIIPSFLREEELEGIERPEIDQKIVVSYYKYSRLIYSWKRVE